MGNKAIKRNELWLLTAVWMKLTQLIVNERGQIQKCPVEFHLSKVNGEFHITRKLM